MLDMVTLSECFSCIFAVTFSCETVWMCVCAAIFTMCDKRDVSYSGERKKCTQYAELFLVVFMRGMVRKVLNELEGEGRITFIYFCNVKSLLDQPAS